MRLDERPNDGNYAEVRRSGNAVFQILSQYTDIRLEPGELQLVEQRGERR